MKRRTLLVTSRFFDVKMNRRTSQLTMGLILLLLGWGCSENPVGPDPVCGGQSGSTIVTFEDANLEAAIRSALSVGPQEGLTCALTSELTVLDAASAEIMSLLGVENLTNLETLSLPFNSITDISALRELTSLEFLNFSFNSDLSDIQPLLDNAGLGAGDLVHLGFTNVSCPDFRALRAKGVTVGPTGHC